MTKHDFKRVLHDKNRCAYLSPQDHDTIRFALLLADKVTGEPSEEMSTDGVNAYLAFETHRLGDFYIRLRHVFKAMVVKAMKEIECHDCRGAKAIRKLIEKEG